MNPRERVMLALNHQEPDRIAIDLGGSILVHPEEVAEEVKQRIDDLAAGGGFVFAPVHNIQADVPPENIVAVFETALKYGK